MADFRMKLYKSYVSHFKSWQLQTKATASSGYNRWCIRKYFPLISDINKDAAILELGCGPGHLLNLLRDNNFTNVTGIDISEEQIKLARKSKNTAYAVDVFEYLKQQDQMFDVVIAIDFFEHFNKEELLLLSSMIYKSLKPGGRVLLQTPNGGSPFAGSIIYGDLTHMSILTPTSLRQMLSIYGFNNFKFVETGPVPKDTVGVFRLILWSFIRIIYSIIYKIETGKSQSIWTENMICYCYKSK